MIFNGIPAVTVLLDLYNITISVPLGFGQKRKVVKADYKQSKFKKEKKSVSGLYSFAKINLSSCGFENLRSHYLYSICNFPLLWCVIKSIHPFISVPLSLPLSSCPYE